MLAHVLVSMGLAVGALAAPAAAQGPASPSSDEAPGRNAQVSRTLSLTAEEKHTVLENVDRISGNSTLGLGALEEGESVPRTVTLQKFNDTVVTKVPKLKNLSYFSVENKMAIVDATGRKIVTVLEHRPQ